MRERSRVVRTMPGWAVALMVVLAPGWAVAAVVALQPDRETEELRRLRDELETERLAHAETEQWGEDNLAGLKFAADAHRSAVDQMDQLLAENNNLRKQIVEQEQRQQAIRQGQQIQIDNEAVQRAALLSGNEVHTFLAAQRQEYRGRLLTHCRSENVHPTWNEARSRFHLSDQREEFIAWQWWSGQLPSVVEQSQAVLEVTDPIEAASVYARLQVLRSLALSFDDFGDRAGVMTDSYRLALLHDACAGLIEQQTEVESLPRWSRQGELEPDAGPEAMDYQTELLAREHAAQKKEDADARAIYDRDMERLRQIRTLWNARHRARAAMRDGDQQLMLALLREIEHAQRLALGITAHEYRSQAEDMLAEYHAEQVADSLRDRLGLGG